MIHAAKHIFPRLKILIKPRRGKLCFGIYIVNSSESVPIISSTAADSLLVCCQKTATVDKNLIESAFAHRHSRKQKRK
jgi:hypothetical protein